MDIIKILFVLLFGFLLDFIWILCGIYKDFVLILYGFPMDLIRISLRSKHEKLMLF